MFSKKLIRASLFYIKRQLIWINSNFNLEIRERDNIFKVGVELSEKHASCSLGSEKGTYLKENGYENIMTLSKASEMTKYTWSR